MPVARPVFLSYSWDDIAEADELDRQLRVRCVPVWRDRRDMKRSGYMEASARQAILRDCSGFELLGTPNSLPPTGFISDVELPAMDQRARSDPSFFTGATFLQLSIGQAAALLKNTEGSRLTSTLGFIVRKGSMRAALAESAAGVLTRYVDSLGPGPLVLHVETWDELPWRDPADLHLSWQPQGRGAERLLGLSRFERLRSRLQDRFRRSSLIPDDPWADELVPALRQLRQALVKTSKTSALQVRGKMFLSVALALGYEFRQATNWSLDLDHPYVPCSTAPVVPELPGWTSRLESRSTRRDGTVAVLVHATHDITNAVRRHRSQAGLDTRAELHLNPQSGPSRTSVDPTAANTLAAGIAEAVRAARSDCLAQDTHLYLAGPWPLAALIGWHLGSSGRVTAFEATQDRSSYVEACQLL